MSIWLLGVIIFGVLVFLFYWKRNSPEKKTVIEAASKTLVESITPHTGSVIANSVYPYANDHIISYLHHEQEHESEHESEHASELESTQSNKESQKEPRLSWSDVEKWKFSPKKGSSKGESICKQTLEKIFSVEFENKRPKFLRNPETGGNLEIDCYNESLMLGVEYNGVQHYRYTSVFHKSKKDFIAQLRRDDYKKRACKEVGITLINVPYTIPINDIPIYLVGKLHEHGYLFVS